MQIGEEKHTDSHDISLHHLPLPIHLQGHHPAIVQKMTHMNTDTDDTNTKVVVPHQR